MWQANCFQMEDKMTKAASKMYKETYTKHKFESTVNYHILKLDQN